MGRKADGGGEGIAGRLSRIKKAKLKSKKPPVQAIQPTRGFLLFNFGFLI
jgi:hypothetical protein